MEVNASNVVKTNFIQGYDMLPAKYQTPVRDAIMSECEWNLTTFHNKRRGDVRISGLEAGVIEKHFTKHNIDPWTGERLST